MDSNSEKTCTCEDLIWVLALDPFYGVKLSKDDSREPNSIDSDSPIPWAVRMMSSRVLKDSGEKKDKKAECSQQEDLKVKAIYYEAYSKETKAILNSIYDGKPNRQRFKDKFERLPCKTDLLRHLVYSWCGILGLPYTRNGQSPKNQETDILEHWAEDFEFKVENLKIFLRNHNWPLPVGIFEDEPDNTKNKVSLTSQEFQNIFYIKVELLTKLQQQLDELNEIKPSSLDEQERKIKKYGQLQAQIQTIVNADITSNGRLSANTRQAERSIGTLSRYLYWNRLYLEIKRKAPKKSDTWISLQIAKQQEGQQFSSETIRRRMKTK